MPEPPMRRRRRRKSPKRSKEELAAENRILRRQRGATAVAGVLNTAIRWTGLVLFARYLYMSAAALAGKTTEASFLVELLANQGVVDIVMGFVGCGGVLYGYKQRKLRRDVVERIQARNKKLEQLIDAGRTTSSLTTRGETRPEDLE